MSDSVRKAGQEEEPLQTYINELVSTIDNWLFGPTGLSDMSYEICFRTVSREKKYLSTSSQCPLIKVHPISVNTQHFQVAHVQMLGGFPWYPMLQHQQRIPRVGH